MGTMVYRPLGRTGVQVSVASLGMGGQSRLGQATHRDRGESARVVLRALELGINLIDTAPTYNESEALLGEVLAEVPRSEYLLATKVEPNRTKFLSPNEIVASCERSLQRLRTDYVDLLQFHNVTLTDYPQVVERLYPTLVRLREQGKVRFVGLTERKEGRSQSLATATGQVAPQRQGPPGDPFHQMLAQGLQDDLWDTVGLKYGVLHQTPEREMLPRAKAGQVGVLNMSSVRVALSRPDYLRGIIAEWAARGLLTPDARAPEDPLGFLLNDDVANIPAAGYKFAIGHEAISTVVIGTGSVAHLEGNVASILGPPLPAEQVRRLRQRFGAIAEGV